MSYKIPYLILTAWLSTFLVASAQTDNNRKISLSGQYNYSTQFKSWHFSAPQIGFGWQNKKNNWHELDLTEMQLSKSRDYHVLSASLRYQYNIMPFKRFEYTRFKPFIGIGGTVSSSHSKTQMMGALNYDVRHFTTSLQAHVSPGIEYNFSKKFYASLQFPITPMRFKTVNSRFFDPAILVSEQQRATSSFNLFPLNNIETRLSIGYKF